MVNITKEHVQVLKDINKKLENYLEREFPNKIVIMWGASHLDDLDDDNSETYGTEGIGVRVRVEGNVVYYQRIKNN